MKIYTLLFLILSIGYSQALEIISPEEDQIISKSDKKIKIYWTYNDKEISPNSVLNIEFFTDQKTRLQKNRRF